MRLTLIPLAAVSALALLGAGSSLAAQPGLALASAPYRAEIIRDEVGVPHVYGDTDAATAFGLAYAQAEDDMDSMEDAILLARARLSSKHGEAALMRDKYSALLQGQRIARQAYDRDIPPELQRLLAGYAAGINHYLAVHPEEGRFVDNPVDAQDIVAFWYVITPMFFGIDAAMQRAAPDGATLAARSGTSNQRLGSNAFAIAPGKSTDGVTRLMANSHQPWEGMLTWYEAGFHSKEGLDFYGGMFPATPFPHYGHNAKLGWSYTLNRPDVTDVYALRMDPANPHRYWWDGAWRDTVRYPTTYVVKEASGDRSIDEDVEWSVHGPIFRAGGKAFAVRYSSIGEARELTSLFGLVRSHDVSEWRKVFARQGSPTVNYIYADRAGNIGLFYNARLPRRDPAFVGMPILPGDDPEALWTQYLPASMSPVLFNPKSGYVFNGNNGPFLATGARDNLQATPQLLAIGVDAEETNRGQRLYEQFSASGLIGRQQALDIKFDCRVSRATRYISDYLAAASRISAKAGTPLAEGAQLIAEWDGQYTSSSKGSVLAAFLVAEAESAQWGKRSPRPAGEVLEEAVTAITAAYGRLDPALGEVVRLRRGSLDLPIDCGGPDALRAINGEPQPDGKVKATVGDSLIFLVEWGKDGKVHTLARHQYGAAATRPASPHYADQAKPFLARELRQAWFYPDDVRRHASRTYSVESGKGR